MPSLQFKGKSFIQNYHLAVPFHELIPVKEKSLSNKPSLTDNLIIHGDNLKALKSLLPIYAGKVNCIYIDPPYNTRNEKWVYNDNVNSPMMQEWFGKVVDGEDLTRHDKWLCMMTPRLKLLRELLSDNGIIFISIDDNELHNLLSICSEIFGEGNHLTTFTWVRKKKGSFLSDKIRKMTDFVVCFQKNPNKIQFFGEEAYSEKWQPIVKRSNQEKILEIKKGVIETTLENGVYKKGERGTEGTSLKFLESFEVKDGKIVTGVRVSGRFVWTQDFLDIELAQGTKISLSKKFGFNVLRFDQEDKTKTPSTLINSDNGVGTNEDATQELSLIFNEEVGKIFQYSKPVSLIRYLVNMVLKDQKDSIVLDSFAGSGTTGQAVLELNLADGGNRKFVLVECEEYAEKVTLERIKRVSEGVKNLKDETLKKGLGGSFTFCDLGEPMDEQRLLAGKTLPTYEEVSRYVFYVSTGEEFKPETIDKKTGFIGESSRYQVYLFYEPKTDVLRNLALDSDKAEKMKPLKAGKKRLVFAPTKYLDQEYLDKYQIDFAQLPYEIYQRAK